MKICNAMAKWLRRLIQISGKGITVCKIIDTEIETKYGVDENTLLRGR